MLRIKGSGFHTILFTLIGKFKTIILRGFIIIVKVYLLQHGWQGATLAQPSPTGDSRVLADEKIISGRQTNRRDMRSEGQRAFQSNQRQIVFVSEEIILRMDHLLGHSAFHVRQSLLHRRKIVLAYSDPDLRGQQAATESISNISLVLHSYDRR